LPGTLAVMLSLVGTGPAGCSANTKSCNGMGCAAPITVTATIAGPARGPVTVTFCKGPDCEDARADVSLPEIPDTTGVFDLGVGGKATDSGGLALTVVVRSAPNLVDGEKLRLRVVDESGAVLLDWSTTSHYERHSVNGPGCGECAAMVATVTA